MGPRPLKANSLGGVMRVALRAATFTLLISVAVQAGDTQVVGTYSSFRVSARSGDLGGLEISIVPDPIGHSAVVQGSEGAPAFPVVVPVTVAGSRIEFTIPEPSRCGLAPGTYSGVVSPTALDLSGPPPFSTKLPRKRSYWSR